MLTKFMHCELGVIFEAKGDAQKSWNKQSRSNSWRLTNWWLIFEIHRRSFATQEKKMIWLVILGHAKSAIAPCNNTVR